MATDREEARGDLLLIASGRKPTVAGLDLEKAGINYSEGGIPVDDRLRTNVTTSTLQAMLPADINSLILRGGRHSRPPVTPCSQAATPGLLTSFPG